MYRTVKLLTTPKADRDARWEADVYLAWQLYVLTCGMFAAAMVLFFGACWVTR